MLAACSLPSFCSLLLSHSEVQPYGLPVLLFFLLLGPHMQHLEVPRLWVEQELHLLAYTKPQQHRILATSVTYTAVHSNAGLFVPLSKAKDESCVLMDTSQVRYHSAMVGTPTCTFCLHTPAFLFPGLPQSLSSSCSSFSLLHAPLFQVSVRAQCNSCSFFFFFLFRATPTACGASPG